jgi:uncharacterized protein
MKPMERRIKTLDRIELRAGENGARVLEGHAAVFNVQSDPMWGFIELIAPGCFTRAIKEDDVRALFNHDANYILGRNTSETLRLSEDSTGLAFSVDLNPKDPDAERVAAKIERGDVTGCSFGFRTLKDEWDYKDENTIIRTLLEVELFDVGPVTFPAYPETDVSMRSMTEIAEEGKRRLIAQIEAKSPKQVPLAMRKQQLAALEAML